MTRPQATSHLNHSVFQPVFKLMSTTTSCKVSVVIPTRNRHDVLAHCLRTVVDQDHENLEVIVSDNCSTSETREVVEAMRSNRVRYVRPGRPLSMSHNFEFGLAHASGDWIVVLGDDDGLLPGGLRKALDLVLPTGLKCLASVACVYNWPSVLDGRMPVLEVPWRKNVEIRDSITARQAVLRGDDDYRSLPILYTGGMVHASLLDKIRPDGGPFIRSQIPDVYSGFALTSVTDRFVFSHQPFAIGGRSSYSNGLLTLLRFTGELAPFHSDDLIPFHPAIPLPSAGTLTFSLEALEYESHLQSQFLRPGECLPDPTNQLILILSKLLPAYRKHMAEWASQFATLHGLDLEAALQRERAMAGKFKRQRWRRGLDYALRHQRIFEDQGASLVNVFEASIAAARMVAAPPELARNQLRFALHLLRNKFWPSRRQAN